MLAPFTLDGLGEADACYGEEITLYDDGVISISGYDGITKLKPDEALCLAEALIAWANKQKLISQ